MVEVTATVRNTAGIHCRPSAEIVRAILGFPGNIEVISGGGSCDPRSILNLIALGLTEGAEVTIRVSGEGEADFARKLVELFERHFDFPPRAGDAPPLAAPGRRPAT